VHARSLGIFAQPTERVDAVHLLRAVAANMQELGTRHNDREALCARDGDIQTVLVVEEFDVARKILASRRRHRELRDPRRLGFRILPVCRVCRVNGTGEPRQILRPMAERPIAQ
jgi:hypothetical protein